MFHLLPCLVLLLMPLLTTVAAAVSELADDPRMACDRAAVQAERIWNIPPGLLAAIGSVESGRSDGLHRRGWPWSINAEGWSHYAASKTEAIGTVRALQARGFRYIDVGCFQVDLFFHPWAFDSLEEAFDPAANAQAASRILMLARFGATGWEPAIAAYHSTSMLRGSWYLQRVLSVWPAARARLAGFDMAPVPLPSYAVLLSAEARLVRVVTATDPAPVAMAGLPRVIAPADVPAHTRLDKGPADLPRVLTLPDLATPSLPRRL